MEVMTKCVQASIENGQTSQVSSVPELAAKIAQQIHWQANKLAN